MTKREAVIEGSEVHILQSELTGKTYRLSVALPYDYHDEPDKKWPVVYHLDGNTYFGMITEIVRSMAWCGMTRDAIVAGIGYATGTIMREAWHDRLTMRMHDLTPDRDRERENRAMEEWNDRLKLRRRPKRQPAVGRWRTRRNKTARPHT